MLLENFLWKKFHDFINETAKVFVAYLKVLQDGFVKRPCDADLVFCSWVSDVRMNTFEKTEEEFTQKMFTNKLTIAKRNKIGKLNYI